LAAIDALAHALGASFKDVSLLEQALVHGSYVNENPEMAPVSNERLEFLGDAVLGLVVAEKLYRDYPAFDEGELTRLRAALVRRETLARLAAGIGLGDYLYLGKGEDSSGGRRKPANLASALEAIIAAVFLDQGLAEARRVVLMLLDDEIEAAVAHDRASDYKTELQHITQARRHESPTYELVTAAGAEHGKTFTVEVRLGLQVLGRGSGKSKKAAESEAAREALQRLSQGFTQ
jgi:ribonuclease III